MFKLLKELAKAPEPLLSASGSHSPYSAHSSDGEYGGLSYKPRSRAGTLQQSQHAGSSGNAGGGVPGDSRRGSFLDDVEETDKDAMEVVKL